LNEFDRERALHSLRILVDGIPIRDDEETVIGWIEKPSCEAIKIVLAQTEDKQEQDEDVDWD
jgi:hypothetical protein